MLASSGADRVVKVWDVEHKTSIFDIEGQHNDTIQDFQWNQLGSIIATQCRDKFIRLFDVRTGQKVSELKAHQGAKCAHLAFNNTRGWMMSVGFGQGSNRQLLIWDLKDPSKPLHTLAIDQASGVMYPFFDEATQILFITGKGEQNIRYYELTDEAPHCFYLSTCQEGSPQRGITALPKQYVNTKKCEIMRFYRLTDKDTIEPLSMIVPRRSEMFQADIFPPVVDSTTASMTCDEWKGGKDTPRRYFVFNAEGKPEYCDAEKAGTIAAIPVTSTSPTPSSNDTVPKSQLDEANKKLAEKDKTIEELKAKIAELEAKLNQ